jgi:transposase
VSRDTTYGRATVRQLCAAFKISRQAYYQAQSTPVAEASDPRPEREGPWATAAELEAKVRECAESHPAWGVRKVHAHLRRQKVVASRKRVWAVMKRLGLVLPAPEHREEGARLGTVTVPEGQVPFRVYKGCKGARGGGSSWCSHAATTLGCSALSSDMSR